MSITSRQADNSPCLKLLEVSLGDHHGPWELGLFSLGDQLPISLPNVHGPDLRGS